MEINKTLWEYSIFLDKIFKNLENDKIDISNYELDHICYRVESYQKYLEIKNQLLEISILLTETLIWWRNISTFKLNKPLIYKKRKIYLIELPSPKKWSNYSDWYEHIEFVIDESFESFIKKYSNIIFNKKAIKKRINPDIKIEYKNSSVKFHHSNLEKVIIFEQNN
jgi:predicted metalloenzyme YecM